MLKMMQCLSQPILSDEDVDFIHFRTSSLCELVFKCSSLSEIDPELLTLIEKALEITSAQTEDVAGGYVAPLIKTGCKGRPAYNITKNQLEFYLEHNFSGLKIAKMLHVSLKTVKRHMFEYGLQFGQVHTDLTDEELDFVIHQLITTFPNCGYRRMDGLLVAKGIKVSEK